MKTDRQHRSPFTRDVPHSHPPTERSRSAGLALTFLIVAILAAIAAWNI